MKNFFISLCIFSPVALFAQNKVGVGTNSPQQRLSVDSTLVIDQGNFDDGTKPALRFGSGSGEAIGSRRIAAGTNPFGLDFWTNSNRRMVISNGGNVGIGENTPGFPLNFASTLGDKISLYGNSGSTYGLGIQNLLLQIHTDVIGADIAFGYGSSGSFVERMRVKGNGMVGIGITNPIEQLHVYDTANTGYPLFVESNNSSAAFISIGSRNNTSGVGVSYYRSGVYKGDTYLNPTNDYQVDLASVGNILFGKNSNGFIGLGTTSPQQNLSVNNGMNIDQANINNGTLTNGLSFGSGSGEGIASKRSATGNQFGLDFYTNFTNRMSVTSLGKVGIGTSAPGAKLQINQVGNWQNSENVDNALEIWDNAETLYMGADEINNLSYIQAVGNGFVHTLALNPRTGNVAIGKSSATVPLDVAGNIKTSGDIQVQTDRGIVRNSGTEQLKYVVTGAALATTQAAFQTDATGLLFAQTFSATPTVYVANILPNGANPLGDIDKVFITLYNVTTTGCSMKVHNAHNASITFNAVWQIVAIGPQ
jgi:hypothetical protein